MIDYYKVLGVEINASHTSIKIAYRQRALRYHPDHGGTHEQMVQINEAYSILGHPERRRRYDLARSTTIQDATHRAAEEDIRHARNVAADYPRDWPTFEAWLDLATKDFSRADFKPTTFRIYGVPLPKSGASLTGWAFIIGGAIGGASLVGVWLEHTLPAYGMRGAARRGAGLLMLFGLAIGAWLGVLLHGLARKWLEEVQKRRNQ